MVADGVPLAVFDWFPSHEPEEAVICQASRGVPTRQAENLRHWCRALDGSAAEERVV
jgi:hypothetical protein